MAHPRLAAANGPPVKIAELVCLHRYKLQTRRSTSSSRSKTRKVNTVSRPLREEGPRCRVPIKEPGADCAVGGWESKPQPHAQQQGSGTGPLHSAGA